MFIKSLSIILEVFDWKGITIQNRTRVKLGKQMAGYLSERLITEIINKRTENELYYREIAV
jgi:hypothetical protein